jgi:preprotein translocase subunit SecG
MGALLATLLLITAIFLILLILVQRGRGGGLTGALGGMGGQSAFGTKAGDVFTRITIGVAAFWILLSAAAVKYYGHGEDSFAPGLGSASKAIETPSSDPFSKGAATTSGATTPGATMPGADSATPPGATVNPATGGTAAPASTETPAKMP